MSQLRLSQVARRRLSLSSGARADRSLCCAMSWQRGVGVRPQLLQHRLESRFVIRLDPRAHVLRRRLGGRPDAREPCLVLAPLLEQPLDGGGALGRCLASLRPYAHPALKRLRLSPIALRGGDDPRRSAPVTPFGSRPRRESVPIVTAPWLASNSALHRVLVEIRNDALAQFRRPRLPIGYQRHRSHYEDKLRQQIVRNLLSRNSKARRRGDGRARRPAHRDGAAECASVSPTRW